MSTRNLQAAKATAPSDTEWEFASLWKRAWRIAKWAIFGVLILIAMTVIGQGFLYYQMFAALHPIAGIAFVLGLLLLLLLLVGRPLLAYFNTPTAANPPAISVSLNAPQRDLLILRLKYDVDYLKSFLRNPELKAVSSQIKADLLRGKALLANLRKAPSNCDPQLVQDILAFEADCIEAHLKPLDEKVDKIIHAEAVRIGIGTAVSMNGTIDAFIVLWRSANLIARVSRIYFGRPNLRGSLIVMRDIAAFIILSRALEDVTSITGELIGTMLGKMGGLVAGPVVDGSVNALMALKLGYLTKRRCRAYQGWQPEQAQTITSNVLKRVQKEASSVVGEILKAVGGISGTAAKATESVMNGSKQTWSTIQSWFGGKATTQS